MTNVCSKVSFAVSSENPDFLGGLPCRKASRCSLIASRLWGDVDEIRSENGKYRLAIRLRQRLPVSVTRLIGPPIVRGIP